jgi:hypothetical protein
MPITDANIVAAIVASSQWYWPGENTRPGI